MYQQDPKKRKLAAGPMAPQQIQPLAAAPSPVAPEKGALSQFGDMAKQQVMTKALDKGMTYGGDLLSKGITAGQQALAPQAASGGMGAAMGSLGTAMPYVGMGLLGAKMLGLFSKGGYVGPLSGVAYQSQGGKISASFYNKTKE